MEINFGKIEFENVVNIVDSVKRSEFGADCQWMNINATTVVCGDKQVNDVTFHVMYNMNDRLICIHVDDSFWNIIWDNNDISFDDVKKLFEKIALIPKDEDGFYVFENFDEIIEFREMFRNYADRHDILYSEYIEYLKNYINK